MKPTVGRIVHFFTASPSEQSNNAGIGPYAAIITRVWGDSLVNLTVFPDNGPPVSYSSVSNVIPEDRENMQGRAWAWPAREESGVTAAQKYVDAGLAADNTAAGSTGLEGKVRPLIQFGLDDARELSALLSAIERPSSMIDNSQREQAARLRIEIDAEIASRTT